MPRSNGPIAERLTAALLAAGLALAGASATATAAPIPAAQRISSQLQRATGYRADQLTSRPACGSVPANRIHCYARVLAARSDGQPVAPLHAPAAPRSSPATRSSASGAPVAAATAAPSAYTPAFLQSAYDVTWLAANRGAGDTVAIVDAYGDPSAYSDLQQFRSANGLPSLPTCGGTITTSCFELVNQSGQTTNLPGNGQDETGSWNIEESLDLDAVSALCPRCKILMVEATTDDSSGQPDLETAVSTAAALGANQISLSWGQDIPPSAAANAAPYSSITSAAILAAAGDSAYPGPYVGYPAALPSVTAVGGTSLTADPGVPRGFDETTWSQQSCGGGTCGTESGCDTSQAVPAFQLGIATGCSGRAYNDVSADGDPNTGLEIYDSQPGSEGCGTTNHWCIVGGTSLATPLTAAIEGLTAVAGTTPAWAYQDASLLQDITAGSDGTCPSGWSLICTAATGWDGPTGNGSPGGQLTSGGPGTGGESAIHVNGNDVTLAGGLYPNGEATTYQWRYWLAGQSSTTASSTPATALSGATLTPVQAAICGLATGTTYDYDVFATNQSGSATSYQSSFTTAAAEAPPTIAAAPAITGSPVAGQTLAAEASWNNAGCNSAPSYQWQEATASGGPWTAVGTDASWPLTSADVGRYLRVAVSERNGAGTTQVTSAVVGPVAPAPSGGGTTTGTTTTGATTTATTTGTTSGATGTTAGGTGAATTSSTTPTDATPTTTANPAPTSGATTRTTVRFYRCARTCRLIPTHGARTYRPGPLDRGRYLKVVTEVRRTASGRTRTTVQTRWVGPIAAASAGSIAFATRARVASTTVIRGTTGRPLAQVRVISRRGGQLTLAISPVRGRRVRVWAYRLSGRAVRTGTASVLLRHRIVLRVAQGARQTVRLVAVST